MGVALPGPRALTWNPQPLVDPAAGPPFTWAPDPLLMCCSSPLHLPRLFTGGHSGHPGQGVCGSRDTRPAWGGRDLVTDFLRQLRVSGFQQLTWGLGGMKACPEPPTLFPAQSVLGSRQTLCSCVPLDLAWQGKC